MNQTTLLIGILIGIILCAIVPRLQLGNETLLCICVLVLIIGILVFNWRI